jgi:predicted secreted protein
MVFFLLIALLTHEKYLKGLGDASQIVSLKMKNAKALHIIQLSCGRHIQHELFNFKIARDAWDHLSTRYDKILKIKIDKGQQGTY